MRKREKSKAAAVIAALALIALILTGCTAQKGAVILYESNTLKIEREAAETRVFDLTDGATYTFTARRVKKADVKPVQAATVTADTETINIQTVYGLIIVTEKATGKTLYVK